jgi:hypothetical protein
MASHFNLVYVELELVDDLYSYGRSPERESYNMLENIRIGMILKVDSHCLLTSI